MGVFKAYDVRGTYPDQIDEDLFGKIGLAAGLYFGARTAVVGRDMRTSGISLTRAMIRGLTQAGVNVIDIGMTSTPMLYFATAQYKAGLGIQITASHNPAGYNGCKFCREDAIPVAYDTGLNDIEAMLAKGALAPSNTEGNIETADIGPEYLARLLKYSDGLKPLTVAVDAGNGVMGLFLPKLFEKLPCELLPLFFEPDGSFPNHEANPLKAANMRDLQAKVKADKADLGVAFDGDGDRCMFVDEKGELIPADFITALLAREMLVREPGATVLYDLRSSWVCKEEIEKYGGKAMMCRVGHSYIKAAMRETKAIFAGELSGHMYFRDIHYTDNAEMAMLAVLAILSKTGAKLSELIAPFRRYYASGEINFEVHNAAASVAAVEKALTPEASSIERLDGLSVIGEDWWCNVRASNTEPVLRLNLEAKSAGRRDEKLRQIQAIIKSS